MFLCKFFLPPYLLAFLHASQSCQAAGLPSRAKILHEPVRRQHTICEEQLVITQILTLVPVSLFLELCGCLLTSADSDQHIRYLKYNFQRFQLFHFKRYKCTYIH